MCRRQFTGAVVAALAFMGLGLGGRLAHAETITLVCSNTPGGPPAFYFDVNFDQSTVSYPAPNTPAQISDQAIVWERPRYEDGSGTVIVAGRYVLDRTTGTLSSDNYCEPQDWEWCGAGSLSYCQRGAKLF